MGNMVCKECQATFAFPATLHRHLKSHKMTMEVYYHKHFPRYDLFTGELIWFKSLEHYLACDFNSKDAMQSWFKTHNSNECRDMLTRMMYKQKEAKKLKYTPCQVELRSATLPPMPSVITFEKYLPYYEFCAQDFGLINKFKYVTREDIQKVPPLDKTILVDTREQRPLEFSGPIKSVKLEVGDYAIENPTHSPALMIERKTICDFIGTLGRDFSRFKREIDRARQLPIYIVVLVEESLSNALDFVKRCDVSPHLVVTPEYIFHHVRAILQRESHIQFLFTNNRDESSRVAEKLLASKSLFKEADLQKLYDERSL
jgi:hypothetical protein